MGRLGFNLSQQQVVVLHQALDADGNHEISLDEFTQVGVYQLYVYMPLKLVMFQAVIAEDEKYLAQNVPGKSKEIDTANEAKDARLSAPGVLIMRPQSSMAKVSP